MIPGHGRDVAEPLEPNPDCPSYVALAGELRAIRKVVDKLSADLERRKARKTPTS